MQETLQRLAASLSFQDVLRMLTGAGLQPPSQALVDFFNGTASGTFESQVRGTAEVAGWGFAERRETPWVAIAGKGC